MPNEEPSKADITQTEKLDAEGEVQDPSMLEGEDVSDLLFRLSTAHDVAQEVEQKLDAVLENLDRLLGMLDSDACPDEPKNSEHPQ